MAVARIAIAAALVVASCGGSSPRPGGSASRESPASGLSTDTGGALSNVERRNPPHDNDSSIVIGNYPTTQQVDVIAYPPPAAVAPGQRFALTISVTPRANMHVYAPGANGYKTVALTVAPTSFVHARPLTYPPSEIYEFKPLNERVPAYRKPFTLVQEMTLDGSAAARAALRDQKSLTITGRFDYQACDDGTCYNPSSVPLAWTINLKQ